MMQVSAKKQQKNAKIDKLSKMTTNPKITEIEYAACDCFYIDRINLYQRSRIREIVEARYLIIYVLVTTLGVNINQASRIYGLDHSTGHYAMKEVRNWIKQDKAFRNKVDNVMKKISNTDNNQSNLLLCL